MRKIRTLLALCLIFLGVTSAMADAGAKSFSIDLTKEEVQLPEGVTQISYPQNGAGYNDEQHGWHWYAIEFSVDGAADITIGGCNYQSQAYGYITDGDGNKIYDFVNDDCEKTYTYKYEGGAKKLRLYCGQYCPSIDVKMAAPAPTGFQDFKIDLTKNPIGDLPAGVEQVSYPKNGASFNGAQHGWCWFAAKFAVDGPVKITIGGCMHINAGYEGYVTDAEGNKLGDLKNKTEKCFDADGSSATFTYKGEPTTLIVYCGQYCPMLKVEKVNANMREKVIYKTKFQDWDAVSSSTTETTVTKKDLNDKDVQFSLMETQVAPEGTNAKFTADCITAGYLMAAKTATPYIKTSTIDNVTTVKFVHSATGSSRGWGLKVKGDGDADWVDVSTSFADQKGTEVTADVKRTNVQLWFYNLNSAQNAYMTSLEIKGNVEVEPRSFTDFTVDFRDDATKKPVVVTPKAGLPEGVTINSGDWHDAQHGFSNVTMTVPVDGPVKFTIGGCTYSKKATVSIDGGTPIDINTQAAGCDSRFGEYNKSVVYTYNVEKPATLTFNLGEYCPFIIAEACDFIPSVVVTYYNTDGKIISEETVAGNSELKFKYAASDVTVPQGQAFRGWFNSKGNTAQKVAEGIALTEDVKLFAKASPIEKAEVGSHYEYDITKAYWYQEDHELISIDGKYYNNHGWNLGANGTIKLDVAGKCYVNIKNCQYSASQTVTVTDSNSKTVATFDAKADADGAATAFQYDGPATTLTFTFPSGSAYVHGVEVFNVGEFLAYDEKTGYYQIAAGDGSGLMLAIKSAKDGDKIFLPNGTYDFGEAVLTQISANNISIIGESMDKTIIRNAPDKSTESIDNTATLLNTSKNLYMQDLTIQNALDYYAIGGTGRAVCLWDKGENTICKNVKMLSYQDTYYSNKPNKFYWEDCEIHGIVDYLCGDGDVIYNRCNFINESRTSNGQTGSGYLCAPQTSSSLEWGYVFLDCSIKSNCESFTFGRSWGGDPKLYAPKAQFIRTKLLDNTLATSRFTIAGMNVAADKFKEYMTTNAAGIVTTPKSNVIEFTHSTGNKKYETVLSDEEAAKYTVANIFGEWAPDKIAAQVTDETAGSVFLVNGKITTVRPTEGKFRIANSRGGFGPEIDLTALKQIDGKDITAQYIKNADLSDGLNGWTANNFAATKKQVNSDNATEAYAGWASLDVTEYSLTQKIKLPAGSYKLINNSFFRQDAAYNSDATKSLAILKAGDKKIAIKTLASETAKTYANSQTEGAGAFTSGMYANEIDFELTMTEEIEIGIVGTFDVMKSWCIVGGFKLIDMNQKADIIDMSNKIANHSFENGLENWTVEGEWGEQTNGEAVQVGARYADKWQQSGGLPAGKISQTITDLENGKYIVKASAIATDEGTQMFVNDKVAAAENSASILSIEIEVTDGKLTIGFERTAENKANWVAVDNFQLFFVQNEPITTGIGTAATTAKAAIKKFIKNGKILIVKNGKLYNVAGAEQK